MWVVGENLILAGREPCEVELSKGKVHLDFTENFLNIPKGSREGVAGCMRRMGQLFFRDAKFLCPRSRVRWQEITRRELSLQIKENNANLLL